MFIAQLNHPEFSRFDLGSLSARHHGRGSVPDRVMKEVAATMHMSEITIAYGMTETSPVSFLRAAATIRWSFVFRRSDGSSRISRSRSSTVTAASFRAAKPASFAPGDTRSCSVTGMTRSGPKEAIDSAGWMHTGDLATIDEDGYCRIVGRIKDMVIRGGETFIARSEEYLYGHPDIQDVQIFGVPDTKYGEELCAWIVAKAGTTLDEEGVRKFCQDRISHYKSRAISGSSRGFPSTVTGKVQKFAMREAMIEEFASERRTAS